MLGDKEAPTDELRRGRAAMHGAGFAGFDDRALLRCVCAEIIDRVDQLGLGPLVLCLQEEVLERTALLLMRARLPRSLRARGLPARRV